MWLMFAYWCILVVRFIVNSITSEFYVYNVFFEVNNVKMQGEKGQTTDDHGDLEAV